MKSRDNDWKPRRAVEKMQTRKQIHELAEKEEQLAKPNLSRQNSKNKNDNNNHNNDSHRFNRGYQDGPTYDMNIKTRNYNKNGNNRNSNFQNGKSSKSNSRMEKVANLPNNNVAPKLTKEQINDKFKGFLNEYFCNTDVQDCCLSITELNCSDDSIHDLLVDGIYTVFEKKDNERALYAKLLVECGNNHKIATSNQISAVLYDVLEFLDDFMKYDVPKADEYFAFIVARYF